MKERKLITKQHGNSEENDKQHLPDPEELANELAKVKSIDDFYGKDWIFTRLFSKTIEQMLEGELTEELWYDRGEIVYIY